MPYGYGHCPECGVKFNVRESSIGTMRRCQACGAKFILHAAPGAGCLQSVSNIVVGVAVLGIACFACCGGFAYFMSSQAAINDTTTTPDAAPATVIAPKTTTPPAQPAIQLTPTLSVEPPKVEPPTLPSVEKEPQPIASDHRIRRASFRLRQVSAASSTASLRYIKQTARR
jgi:hypothetical protein